MYGLPMDWRPFLLAVAPGLMVWLAGLLVTRGARGTSATRIGGRLTTVGFAMVFGGLALLLVVSAVLGGSATPA